MEIDGEQVSYPTFEEVVPTGGLGFEPPVLKLCIADGREAGQAWSMFVDFAAYQRAMYEASGLEGKQLLKAVRRDYVSRLAEVDIDEFEAKMYWQTYRDTYWYSDEDGFDLDAPVNVPTKRLGADGAVHSTGARVRWEDDGTDGPIERITI